jgi:hypothetical protein
MIAVDADPPAAFIRIGGDWHLDLVSLVLAVIGILPVVVGVPVVLQRFQRVRGLLRFARTAPVDVVLTTSAIRDHTVEDSFDHKVVVSRPITGYGQVTGLVSCVRLLSTFYRKKPLRVHLSGFERNRIEGDLVCLGGPIRNKVTQRVLEAYFRSYENPTIHFDDAARTLRIDGDRPFLEEDFDPGVRDGAPATDLGLILLTSRRPTADGISRAIVCAGFTTYGTAAAAEYAFSDLPKMGAKGVRKLIGTRRRGWTGDFVVVVRAHFSRGECVEMDPVYGAVLTPRR